jgi:rubrerythrin
MSSERDRVLAKYMGVPQEELLEGLKAELTKVFGSRDYHFKVSSGYRWRASELERALRLALSMLEASHALSEPNSTHQKLLRQAIPKFRAVITGGAGFHCPECGPFVLVDEDECCASCGADAVRFDVAPTKKDDDSERYSAYVEAKMAGELD